MCSAFNELWRSPSGFWWRPTFLKVFVSLFLFIRVKCSYQRGLCCVLCVCDGSTVCVSCSYRTVVRPSYKLVYRTVTSLEWKCCPGFSGAACEEGESRQTQRLTRRYKAARRVASKKLCSIMTTGCLSVGRGFLSHGCGMHKVLVSSLRCVQVQLFAQHPGDVRCQLGASGPSESGWGARHPRRWE